MPTQYDEKSDGIRHPPILRDAESATVMAVIAVDVIIFSGQGTQAASSTTAITQAILDAKSPAGAVLLSACWDAFLEEAAVLKKNEAQILGMDVANLNPRDVYFLLNVDLSGPIFDSARLFLIQTLRYLAHVTDNAKGDTPASQVEVLGFSSGILPACVVASAAKPQSMNVNILKFCSNAVEVFKLAFWLAVRTALWKHDYAGAHSDPGESWSVVVMGLDQQDGATAIRAFYEQVSISLLAFSLLTSGLTNFYCIFRLRSPKPSSQKGCWTEMNCSLPLSLLQIASLFLANQTCCGCSGTFWRRPRHARANDRESVFTQPASPRSIILLFISHPQRREPVPVHS